MKRKKHETGKKMYPFTLTELLVTVAVITILAALLLPALNSARAKAQSIVCLNNLRTMGTAEQMYSGDFDDFIAYPIAPAAELTDGIYNKGDAWNNRTWTAYLAVYFINGYNNPRSWPHDSKPLKKWQTFWCPLDKLGPVVKEPGNSKDFPRLSYSRPLALVRSKTEYGIRMTNPALRSASKTVALIEHSSLGSNSYRYSYVGNCAGSGISYTLSNGGQDGAEGFRHSNRAGILFLDGHAGSASASLLMASKIHYSLITRLQLHK